MSLFRLCIAGLLFVCLATGEIRNKGWWKNAILYEVYPRSFMDSNDDGVGDLNGITNKLQHFKDLGITIIWLTPIYASPMVDFGYDISDFCKVDPIFGTMDDFENLIKEARKLGLKVVMDLVPNHTSDQHFWFTQSVNGVGKYKDYYVWTKGRNNNTEPPNNWLSAFSGSAWTYNAAMDEWYLHQFDKSQPDLNFNNPDVRKEMEEIIEFWLNKGIDGFRLDAVCHYYEDERFLDEPRSFLEMFSENHYDYLEHTYMKDDIRTYELVQRWRNIVDDYTDKNNEEEKLVLTEAYTYLNNNTKFYYYGSHVPFNFDFIMEVDATSGPEKFKELIEGWVKRVPAGNSSNWVMGNHDRRRLATRFPKRADQMTMLAMILPGIAVTYYGEEIGMEDKSDITWEDTQDPQGCNTNPGEYKRFSRDPVRTPFQWDDTINAGFSKAEKTWLPVHSNYKELNLKKQKSDSVSHYKLYLRLTSLKTNSETLKNGSLKVEILNSGKVLAVVRQSKKQSIILLINFSNEEPQIVDVSKHTLESHIATLYVSSIGSNLTWDSTLVPNEIKLPERASVVLISDEAVPKTVQVLP